MSWKGALPAFRFGMLALLFCLYAIVFGSGAALAHTSLTGASPGQGEVLEVPPEQLHLMFSGTVEPSLSTVEVTGPDGQPVAAEIQPASDGGNMLMAVLPELDNGTYEVAYRVVSADGHPVEGSYTFEVAARAPPASGAEGPEETAGGAGEPAAGEGSAPEAGTDGQQAVERQPEAGAAADAGTGVETGVGPALFTVLLYAVRVAYYAALLPLLGWALWSAIQLLSGDRLTYWRRIGYRLQWFHLIVFVLYVAVHWLELSGGGASLSFLNVLRETGTGQSWLFTGLLSLAGLPLLFQGNRIVDGIWVVLMLAAASLRGHSGAFEPALLTRAVDGLHLGAAALWFGGLLALAVLYRKFPDWFRSFAPVFSAAAMAAFIVLFGSGIATTLLFTPNLSDLLRTNWGLLLIVKVALAVLVLPIAMLLRRKLQADPDADSAVFRRWLRTEMILLAGIIVIAGIFTHLSPAVERVNFHWHEMGEQAHLTAAIADLVPGGNKLSLKIWVPEGESAPAVSAVAVVPGHPDSPAALTASNLPSEPWESFPGFEKYTFEGDIAIGSLEGAELHIRVQRANGDVLDYARALTEGTP